MDNHQVTIAVQAADLTGPLGRVILVVSASLDRSPQHVVILRDHRGALSERKRLELEPGPMTAQRADEIGAWVADEVYTALLFYKGVQEELPVPPV